MQVSVVAHPNSKRPRVEKDLFGKLQVYVSAPPLEGRANQAVILALADYFNVKKSKIKFERGQKSKIKVFEIDVKN